MTDGNQQSQDEFEENSISDSNQFKLMDIQQPKAAKRGKAPPEDKLDVISTIKNFEKLPFTSIKIAREEIQGSEPEEEVNYDISYDIERSYNSNGSRIVSRQTVFQQQIEFKAKRRKYQTDVRAKESEMSESSSGLCISPEKERECDQDNVGLPNDAIKFVTEQVNATQKQKNQQFFSPMV